MRSLLSAAMVAACALGIAAPALAEPHMGAFQTPHMGAFQTPHMSAHRTLVPRHIDRIRHDRDDGHRRRGRHGDEFPLLPFDFFDSGAGPDEIGTPSDDPNVGVAPWAPPVTAADLPPCRETGAGGVVVLRGLGCARDQR
jgi:hypothetical protein